MRYGIFSDIHSNLEAFEAVISAYGKERIDRYLCIGDIVGYGASPSECIGKTRQLTNIIVAGNHDWAAVNKFSLDYFNPIAKEAIIWTKNILKEEEKDFLATLTLIYEESNFVVAHGTLIQPDRFDYLISLSKARENFEFLEKKILFVGHSHAPCIFVKNKEKITFLNSPEIEISEDRTYIINVGSVGQPRDGDWKASYAIYDLDNQIVEIKRIGYNIRESQEKIIRAKLPLFLAIRLGMGR